LERKFVRAADNVDRGTFDAEVNCFDIHKGFHTDTLGGVLCKKKLEIL
jgi:hypothetical protein